MRCSRGREIDRRHFNVQVDTVEQWPGNTAEVPRHGGLRAGARACGVTVIAAWAGVHGGDEHKFTREKRLCRSRARRSQRRPQLAGAASPWSCAKNSGSSSKNSTPLCAREISPGRGIDPPPESPGPEMVWCGERKGRVSMSAVLPGRSPATE